MYITFVFKNWYGSLLMLLFKQVCGCLGDKRKFKSVSPESLANLLIARPTFRHTVSTARLGFYVLTPIRLHQLKICNTQAV